MNTETEKAKCPNCGAEHDREQGKFTFWKCGTWKSSIDNQLVIARACGIMVMDSQITSLRKALLAIFDATKRGSKINKIAADALRGGK